MAQHLTSILTAAEAADLWGLGGSTIRNACVAGRFQPEEARKSGKVWLITVSGMERVYGKPQPPTVG